MVSFARSAALFAFVFQQVLERLRIRQFALYPKFGSWIMCLAAKDAKTAKKMQSDMVFGGLYTGRQIDMISPTG